MSKPIVAVIGRPNVGKSTLFNRIIGRKISITEDTPGVTRDRIYADANWLNYDFTLIDTGGMQIGDDENFSKYILKQIDIAIESADVILFVVDVKTGVTDLDEKVANYIRRSNKKVVLAVNKVDNFKKMQNDIYEFYSLGFGDPIPVSANQGLGLGDLLDEIVRYFPKDSENLLEDDDVIKVAIVGKPNVGKSSIINKILGQERTIVSDMAGTTRDAIDSEFEKNGQKFIFIDTAGIRKKNKIKESIEYYSIVRSISAIERANVCVLVIDAECGITEQDVKIAGIAHEKGKPVIIIVNKWDKIEKDNHTVSKYSKEIDEKLIYMSYAPKLFVSAVTGQRLDKIFGLIITAWENTNLRVSTGVLNELLIEAMAMSQPPSDKGKMLKIYYMTQVSVRPPTFVLFVNDSELLHFSYKRYIENQIRKSFSFAGTPIHFIVKNKFNK